MDYFRLKHVQRMCLRGFATFLGKRKKMEQEEGHWGKGAAVSQERRSGKEK